MHINSSSRFNVHPSRGVYTGDRDWLVAADHFQARRHSLSIGDKVQIVTTIVHGNIKRKKDLKNKNTHAHTNTRNNHPIVITGAWGQTRAPPANAAYGSRSVPPFPILSYRSSMEQGVSSCKTVENHKRGKANKRNEPQGDRPSHRLLCPAHLVQYLPGQGNSHDPAR